MVTFYDLYQKYKKKYLNLKLSKQIGGDLQNLVHIYVEGVSEQYHPEGIRTWLQNIATTCEVPPDSIEEMLSFAHNIQLKNRQTFYPKYEQLSSKIEGPVRPANFRDPSDTPQNLAIKLSRGFPQGVVKKYSPEDLADIINGFKTMDMAEFDKLYAAKYFLTNNNKIIIDFNCLNPPDPDQFENLKTRIRQAN